LTSIILADTKQFTALIVLGYCMAAVIQLWNMPPFLLLGVIVLYAIEHIALRQSLWSFPWGSDESKRTRINVGWPFEQLAPHTIKSDTLSLGRRLIAASELGVWAFSVSQIIYSVNPHHGLDNWAAFAGLFVGFLFLGRWIAYTGGYPSPINIWGRIATGNWIIPKYDRVLIGPLCTLLSGAILILAMYFSGIYPPLQVAICFVIPLLLTLSIGPTLSDWKLTGAHQIRRIKQDGHKQRQRRQRESSSTLAKMLQ
jgi:hypothetical protein